MRVHRAQSGAELGERSSAEDDSMVASIDIKMALHDARSYHAAVQQTPVTAAEIAERIDALRRDLSTTVQRLDQLVRVREAQVSDDIRQARELIESADDGLAQAHSLLG